jgi:hypothetical protein
MYIKSKRLFLKWMTIQLFCFANFGQVFANANKQILSEFHYSMN